MQKVKRSYSISCLPKIYNLSVFLYIGLVLSGCNSGSSSNTPIVDDGLLCNITHESGTFSDYDYTAIIKGSGENDVIGELFIEKAAALAGTHYGLRIMQGIGMSTETHLKTSAVKKLARSSTDYYRMRFYFDTYTLDKNIETFSEFTRLIMLVPRTDPEYWIIFYLDLQDGQFSLNLCARRDNWREMLGAIDIRHNITPGKHMVELRHKKASVKGASDGIFELFVDEESVATTNSVMRFDNFELDRVEIGGYWTMSTLDSYLIDEIVIRNDDKPIGPVKAENKD